MTAVIVLVGVVVLVRVSDRIMRAYDVDARSAMDATLARVHTDLRQWDGQDPGDPADAHDVGMVVYRVHVQARLRARHLQQPEVRRMPPRIRKRRR